ncbi:MAG: hypothetical protein UY87_C0013G0016 [Candidatus Peribacteria bacterium GW2011_GWC2_54_8]|nr:MAG: hypothetical protein UY87_C0013G0016 [Candidatus Peribacteria bacterium GW2011_GWC2_54_8]
MNHGEGVRDVKSIVGEGELCRVANDKVSVRMETFCFTDKPFGIINPDILRMFLPDQRKETPVSATDIEDMVVALSMFGKKSKQFWQLLLEHFVEGQKLFIDRQTSIDLVKIVRVPETLHGGTGLLAKKIQLEGKKPVNWKQFIEGYPHFLKVISNSG